MGRGVIWERGVTWGGTFCNLSNPVQISLRHSTPRKGHEVRPSHDPDSQRNPPHIGRVVRAQESVEGIEDERSQRFVLLLVPELVSQPRRYRRYPTLVSGQLVDKRLLLF